MSITTYKKTISNKLSALAIKLMLLAVIGGCSVARQSRFTSQSVIIGMDKDAVMAKFGTPYKTGFHKDSNQVSYEDWYYKENLYLKKWYEVTSILHFRDGKISSLEPGKETPLYKGYEHNAVIR